MNEEFDYDLTPSQWEALKALRTPAARLPRMSRYRDRRPDHAGTRRHERRHAGHHGKGRKVLIRGSSLLLQDLAA